MQNLSFASSPSTTTFATPGTWSPRSSPASFSSSAGRKEAIGRGVTTCALEGQITAENAPRIKARAIVEGANGPTSSEANPILEEADVFVVPDILANAGG